MRSVCEFVHAPSRSSAKSRDASIFVVACLVLGSMACTAPLDPGGADDEDTDGETLDMGNGAFECPKDGVRGAGRHRLCVQGHDADPLEDGSYPLLHEWGADGSDAVHCDDSVFVKDTNMDGIWQPAEAPCPVGPSTLRHGEHFLVGAGSFAEFRTTLCEDITGEVAFYMPNYDEEGSETIHQLFVVHEGEETLVAEVIDSEAGDNGYNPFIRVTSGVDPDVVPGDTLLLRSTNLNGVPFSVMVFNPPSEYESWVLVEVP